MTNKVLFLAGAACAALIAGDAAAQARGGAAPAASGPARTAAAAAAAPAPTLPQGPALPGVCTINPDATIGRSTVGQYLSTRMQQIRTQVSSELQPEQTSLVNDEKAFEAQRASMDQATLQSRGQALQARDVAFRQKVELRNRELEATGEKALNRIEQELEPVLRQLYAQHRCSVLLRSPAYIFVNPDMDLSAAAVAGLNARLTQFPIDREHLDTAPATPAR